MTGEQELLRAALNQFDPLRFLSGTNAEGGRNEPTDAAIETFRDKSGIVLSAISNRSFLQTVISQLLPLRGRRIFEIGSGTGFLACILSTLCGEHGSVSGCEIIPELYAASLQNLEAADIKNVSLYQGDFVDVLAGLGQFDVIIGTSAFSVLHNSIISSSCTEGALVALPVAIPGGGDCMTIFERCGNEFFAKAGWLSLSVPTTGSYSSLDRFAISIDKVAPTWSSLPKVALDMPYKTADRVRSTVGFRSHLLFVDPHFIAINMGKGALRWSDDMAFGLWTGDDSFCLENRGRLIFGGTNALNTAHRFVDTFRQWQLSGERALADYRYRLDVGTQETFEFSSGFAAKVSVQE